MKGETMPSRVQVEADVLKDLLHEVKETIATDIQVKNVQHDALKAVDFWRIQRNTRKLTGSFKTTL